LFYLRASQGRTARTPVTRRTGGHDRGQSMLRFVTNRIGFIISPLVWITDEQDVRASLAIPEKHLEIAAVLRLINGTRLEIARDGLFIMDFSEATFGHVDEHTHPGVKGRHSDDWMRERLLIANAFLACLHTVMQQGTPSFPSFIPLMRKVAVRPIDPIEYDMVRGAVRDTYMHDERVLLYMHSRTAEAIGKRYTADEYGDTPRGQIVPQADAFRARGNAA
jgi:hypothetical protein